jgi:putative Mg2+ transporter-C (MgtC) family protein
MVFIEHLSQQFYMFFKLALPVGFKVVMAIICGGIVGLEREYKNKPAGLKTNILICLGSTLYTTVSVLIPSVMGDGSRGDPGRVAAQIVSGIGFIGGGAIMRSRANVAGLTTAATIWTVAAIGMCIGSGYPVVAFVFTMTVLFTLLAIDKIETKFIGRTGAHALEIVFDDEDGAVRTELNQVMSRNEIGLDDFDISRNANQYTLHMLYTSSSQIHKRFILDLWTVRGIREVKQL